MTTAPATAANYEEQSLIQSAQRGSLNAYGALVARHRDGVVRVVYRMCGDPDLAEDAAQEAFLRAWQQMDRYRPEHSFRAWVYRIAINAALDALRAGKPTADLEDLEERLASGEISTNPPAFAEERERAGQVRDAVMDLPSGLRAALVLREWGGLSYAEIAAALGLPAGTVMSRLNSARAQLRAALAQTLEVA